MLFFSDKINIKNLNPDMLSINKVSYINTDAVVCNIKYKYIAMESINNQNIDSENPPCLICNDVDAYIIEGSNENKYLILALTKNNKKMLRKYAEIFDEIKN